MLDFDSTKNIVGLLAPIGTALGGLWKFVDWFKQRPTNAKLDAARQLAQWGGETADSDLIRHFGDTQQLRAHFKTVTGIDRHDDHAALLRAHTKLGGRDFDWHTLRRIGAYLERQGQHIVVRDLTNADYWTAAVAALLVVAGGLSSAFFLQAVQDVANSTKGTPAGKLGASIVLGLFATGTSAIAGLFLVFLIHMFDTTKRVRKKLASPDEPASPDAQ